MGNVCLPGPFWEVDEMGVDDMGLNPSDQDLVLGLDRCIELSIDCNSNEGDSTASIAIPYYR